MNTEIRTLSAELLVALTAIGAAVHPTIRPVVIRSSDGRATLTLARTPARVRVRIVKLADGRDPRMVVGGGYSIEPKSLRFDTPATLAIAWDTAAAPGGSSPEA